MQTSSAPPNVAKTEIQHKLPSIFTLYGAPVSNCAARCRFVIYRKELNKQSPQVIQLALPTELGGLKSDMFLTLNPLGKMPALFIPPSELPSSTSSMNAIFESTVICEYLSEKFIDVNPHLPSFIPETLEEKAKSKMICCLLDTYMAALHPYMYKPVSDSRTEGIEKMKAIFDAIEFTLDDNGPYAAGKSLMIADACLWTNFAFYDFILPTFFDFDPTEERPKLKKWRQFMATESDAAKVVYNEIFSALQGWWDGDWWVKLGMEPLTSKPQSSV